MKPNPIHEKNAAKIAKLAARKTGTTKRECQDKLGLTQYEWQKAIQAAKAQHGVQCRSAGVAASYHCI